MNIIDTEHHDRYLTDYLRKPVPEHSQSLLTGLAIQAALPELHKV